MGIQVIVVSILFVILTNYIDIDSSIRIALSVFGIGSGVLLFFLDGYSHLD